MNNFRRSFLTLFLLCLVQSTMAYVVVKGRLASAMDDTPLSGATVRMLQLPDSTLLVGTYSDQDGNFSIASSKISPARTAKNQPKILVIASYMGYVTVEKHIVLRPKEKEYDLKDVYLQENAHILGEALVSATPPPMLIKGDTTEYYADSYKTQPDATVEDLLKRLPGVEVDTDGSIKAQGENVTQVYVDGKEFFGNNTQVTTKNLTANMIESVQVVDMQTEEARLTGIDNGERRKVINLKLKPKMRRGWFGNAAGGWGKGRKISDRWDARGMLGYFYGNLQNALVVNGNNTNNAAFGDTGDNVFRGSNMRGTRQSGARGNGLNANWSIGLNIGYDKGNRMRDPNTPLALNSNISYGGSSQEEKSNSHTIRYLGQDSITENRNFNQGDNSSHNLQVGLRYEKSWGTLKDGQHRIQINPGFSFNRTQTEDYSETHRYQNFLDTIQYLTQTQNRNEMEQSGGNFSISGTYSFAKLTSHGRRRSSVTISFNERYNEGDRYRRSFTTYDSCEVEFDRYRDIAFSTKRTARDTLMNQWSDENSHNEDYRLRLTHIEPINEHNFIEFSASANLTDRHTTQMDYFWDQAKGQWSDSVNGRSNLDYSSDTWVRNVNYNLSASYRMTSETYNVSVGLDLLPQSQQLTEYFDHTRDYKRHYMNYSPRLEYRYNWSRRTNLQIRLNGQTTQPSMNQLQTRKNQNSATHVSIGNPDLSPSFSSNFSAQYHTYNEETYSTLEFGLNARASFNNFVTKRWYSPDLRTDTTQTVNLSGIGNWSASTDFRGSWPFYDNIWYVTNNTSFGYSENQGYISQGKQASRLNTNQSFNGSEQAGIAYRTEKVNVELRGRYSMQHTQATIATANKLGTTHQFGISSNVLFRLPYDFTLTSDFNYTGRRGYSASLTRNQSIWNAQISRSFLKEKKLNAYIKVFDILRQRSAISRSIGGDSYTDRETTVLGQYFLIGLNLRGNRAGGRGGRGGQSGSGGQGRPSGQRSR